MERDVDRYGSLDEQVALGTGATRGIGTEVAVAPVGLRATVYAGARSTDDVVNAALVPVRLGVTNERTIEGTPVWLARFRPGEPGGRLWRDRRVVDW